MHRKALFAGIIIGVVSLAVVAVRTIVDITRPSIGEIKVVTNVAARVLVNGVESGKTPYAQKIAPGEYTIRLVPEQPTSEAASVLAPWEGRITIRPNVLTYVHRDLAETELTSSGDILSLEKIGGTNRELYVATTPSGAQVSVDDVVVGTSPVVVSQIQPGDHSVVISSSGFSTRTIPVKITDGYKTTVDAYLAVSPYDLLFAEAPLASQSASLRPTSTPTPTAGPTVVPTVETTIRPSSTIQPTPAGNVDDGIRIRITDTPTGTLNVREQPTTGSQKLGEVSPGDEFTVVESKSGWHRIEFEDNQFGWVLGQYTQEL